MSLCLEINIDNLWQEVWLEEDFSLDMNDVNEIFDQQDGGMFSLPFKINCEINKHIVGNVDEIRGDSIFKRLYGRRFRISFNGMPIVYGIVKLDDTVDVEDGEIAMELASADREFNDMFINKYGETLRAKDVPLKESVPIGTVIDEMSIEATFVRGTCKTHLYGGYFESDRYPSSFDLDSFDKTLITDGKSLYYFVNPNAYKSVWGMSEAVNAVAIDTPSASEVYPETPITIYNNNEDFLCVNPTRFDGINYANNTNPYGVNGAVFCNSRVTWQKRDAEGNSIREYEGSPNVDNIITAFKQDPDDGYAKREITLTETTELLDKAVAYDRNGSAPNFFILYFLDCLFKYLNINVEFNVLKDIPDARRIAMYHTDVHYEVKGDTQSVDMIVCDNENGAWKCKVNENFINHFSDNIDYLYCDVAQEVSQSAASIYIPNINDRTAITDHVVEETEYYKRHSFDTTINNCVFNKLSKLVLKCNIGVAHATSDNFPDEDARTVFDTALDIFCARYLYDSSTQKLNIVLMNDILADNDVIDVPAIVEDVYKTETRIDGFRLKYKESSSAQDIADADKEKLGDDDSNICYDYHNYSKVTKGDFKAAREAISFYNKRCYYDPQTSNAYRIAVDKDATVEISLNSSDKGLNPVILEVGQFNPAEWGDCSNDDYVDEKELVFSPAIPNIINGLRFKDISDMKCTQEYIEQKSSETPEYAMFADVEMKPVNVVETQIKRTIACHLDNTSERTFPFPVSLTYSRLAYLNYNLEDSDGLGNPLTKNDSGFMLGLLCNKANPNGSNWQTVIADYDDEGNDLIARISNSNTDFHFDTMDNLGNMFNYNPIDAPITYKSIIVTKAEANTKLKLWFDVGNLVCSDLQNPRAVAEWRNYIGVRYKNCIVATTDRGDGVIGMYDSLVLAQAWLNVLNQLKSLDAGTAQSATIQLPTIGPVLENRVSFRLHAEKTNPFYTTDGTYTPPSTWPDLPNTKTFPIVGYGAAHRGLGDKFYNLYAQFKLHSRIATVKIAKMELATLFSIDKKKKYRFRRQTDNGPVEIIEGWIKSIRYRLTHNGLDNIFIELYYL